MLTSLQPRPTPTSTHTVLFCEHASPFSFPFVSMWRAVFLLLFTPVTFWIWWFRLRGFTGRWWWWRWWRGRGWGGRVRLDTSGLIYVHTICYLCYLGSFFLLKEAKPPTSDAHQMHITVKVKVSLRFYPDVFPEPSGWNASPWPCQTFCFLFVSRWRITLLSLTPLIDWSIARSPYNTKVPIHPPG